MSYTGSEILLQSLVKENVEVIFGYPGGAVIPLFDKLAKEDRLRLILPRHEQAAAHAADAYARVSGKVGVCIATSGPGATNTITGIANAYMDSIPMVVITGQVPAHFIGTDAFQEVDTTGIVRPITKHRYLVRDIECLARIVKEAFYIASTGRPGPVVIDLPKNVTLQTIEEFIYPEEVNLRGYKPSTVGHPLQIEKLAKALKSAKKPVAYIGGGVKLANAMKELREFLDITQIPATETLMARGVVDPDYEYNLEMLGMHGTVYANHSVHDCDLLISIGARFDDRVTGDVNNFAPKAKIAHIDIDSASISKIIKVDIPVVGDAKDILGQLNKVVKKCDIDEWRESTLKKIEKDPLVVPYGDGLIHPQYVISQLSELTNGEAVISTDVGQHQMWAAQHYKFRKQEQILTSGGLGTMGVGVPFGLGACVALGGKESYVISGDGGFQMNLQELATIRMENLPVKNIILNNTYLGMVRQWQEMFFQKNYSATELKQDAESYIPDFVKLSESYSIPAERVTKEEDVIPALKRMIDADGPYVLEFMTNPEENVFPMVPAGKSLIDTMRGLA